MQNMKRDALEPVRMRIVVTGRVQGVGYRYFAMTEARRRGISGWVRNCFDGSVEIEAQGSSGAVSDFVAALKAGPPYAVVTEVAVVEIPVILSESASFQVQSDKR
ncbi:acylphosphatase [Bifidobacterium bohemicum]|uniref:acylphosphatase n=1 Tax=Bifidobacterium bohemicum DSM 22767 TaxID=1437606 RepID=A0A086ZEY5_9BIFI|nr:acylphosphatase [Bifidobacterium bohemicum]KFI45085.1 acylphosphatase [Bifidobacterium bohemicum DSM 22767]SCB91994.1 acylphosphatase [Bifidobacterium bohemicum]